MANVNSSSSEEDSDLGTDAAVVAAPFISLDPCESGDQDEYMEVRAALNWNCRVDELFEQQLATLCVCAFGFRLLHPPGQFCAGRRPDPMPPSVPLALVVVIVAVVARSANWWQRAAGCSRGRGR